MTRDQFLALAGQLYDAQVGGSSGGDARPQKYDTVIPRKGGMVQYASECSAKELQFWIAKYQQPPKDPQYADSNERTLKSLRYWLSWRQANPTAIWSGERNRVKVTAAAPSDKPQQYPRGVTAGPVTTPAEPTPDFGETAPEDLSDLPF